MSIDQYSTTPSSNDLTNYFKTGMKPSQVKNAGWDVMADTAGAMSIPTAGGTANALTVANLRPFSLLPSAAQIAAGTFPSLEQWIIPVSVNTGAATFAPDGLGANPIHAAGAALVGGELQTGILTLLKWDGTNWNVINPTIGPAGLLSGALEATIFAGNGNFTPKSTGKYLVIGIGGGGGGGGAGGGNGSNAGGGGKAGGGGSLGFAIVTLTAGTAYAVVIGTGGAGGTGTPASNIQGTVGTVGSNTTFNGVTIGTGGAPATAVRSNSASATGDAGDTGGGHGGGQGGVGGSNTGGAGGNGSNGVPNTGGGGGGGGGGGAGTGTGAGGNGGTGGTGVLIVIRA